MADATGVAARDRWRPYSGIPGTVPTLPLAHILRELQEKVGRSGEARAEKAVRLPRRAIHAPDLAEGGVPPERLADLTGRRYDSPVAEGMAFHESLPPLASKGRRGRTERRRGYDLAPRLRDDRDGVLTFTRNPMAPATDDEAEKAPPPLEARRKIPGSFRAEAGARRYAVTGTVPDTARKRGRTCWKRSGRHRRG